MSLILFHFVSLHSAEADCTVAVQLDDCYVKAYHRRATARIDLKQYKEAAEDIKRVLQFEPTNKEAQSMLTRVNKLIDNAKVIFFLQLTKIFVICSTTLMNW